MSKLLNVAQDGIDIYQATNDGETALTIASQNGHTEIVKYY